MATNYVFVYGTLKSNGWNDSLLSDCDFIGVGIAKGCILIDMGGCPGMVPGVTERHDHDNDAVGEVYAVPDERLPFVLRRLDKLENEGEVYVRVKLPIELDAGSILDCTTYLFMPRINPETVVEGGNWNHIRAREYYEKQQQSGGQPLPSRGG